MVAVIPQSNPERSILRVAVGDLSVGWEEREDRETDS